MKNYLNVRKQECQYVKQVFYEKNDYLKWVINQFVEKVGAKHQTVICSNNLPTYNFEQPSVANEKKFICYYFLTVEKKVVLR